MARTPLAYRLFLPPLAPSSSPRTQPPSLSPTPGSPLPSPLLHRHQYDTVYFVNSIVYTSFTILLISFFSKTHFDTSQLVNGMLDYPLASTAAHPYF